MTKFTKLPQLMKDAMASIKSLHGTPDALAIQSILGVANLAVQGHYDVDSIIFGTKPISLFLVGLVPTGGAKTTIFNELSVGIEKAEEKARIALSGEEERFEIESAIYKKYKEKLIKDGSSAPSKTSTDNEEALRELMRAMSGKSSDKTKKYTSTPTITTPIAKVVKIVDKPKAIQTAKYRTSKGTVNGIIEQLKSQPILGLASSEGGEFFNGHAWQGGKDASKAIEMSAALTTMWDGSRIEKLTGMENTSLANRRINMLFLLQESTIRSFLSNTAFADQGFTHRLLITQCESYKKPIIDNSPMGMLKINKIRATLQPFHDRIEELMSANFKYKDEVNFELAPAVLHMDESAAMLLADYYNNNSDRGITDLKDYAGFSERLYEHGIRLAGTIAAFEKHQTVKLSDAECALELLEFYCEQRKSLNIESTAKNADQVNIANKLIEQIKVSKFDGTLRDFKEVARFGYRKFDNKQREDTLNEMIATGHIEMYVDGRANKIRYID